MSQLISRCERRVPEAGRAGLGNLNKAISEFLPDSGHAVPSESGEFSARRDCRAIEAARPTGESNYRPGPDHAPLRAFVSAYDSPRVLNLGCRLAILRTAPV